MWSRSTSASIVMRRATWAWARSPGCVWPRSGGTCACQCSISTIIRSADEEAPRPAPVAVVAARRARGDGTAGRPAALYSAADQLIHAAKPGQTGALSLGAARADQQAGRPRRDRLGRPEVLRPQGFRYRGDREGARADRALEETARRSDPQPDERKESVPEIGRASLSEHMGQ